MEADWEFEIGGGAPVIEAWWPGFVDLRRIPASVVAIPEAAELPALGDSLIRLNAACSPVWTSKCGLWASNEAEQFDVDEFGAPPGGTSHAHGCYIDLLPRSEDKWQSADEIASVCKSWIGSLHGLLLRSCRADLIIRRAFTPPDRMHLGVTAFLTGSGADAREALGALVAALPQFVDVIRAQSTDQ